MFAQEIVESSDDDFNMNNEIIKVNYNKKSAKRAMLMSAIVPGAGQFYVNKTGITTYIFPVIEAACWAGYIIYTGEGNDQEDEYKTYVNGENINYGHAYYDPDNPSSVSSYSGTRYNRDFFNYSKDNMENSYPANSVYKENHFHLDDKNTQHFYEDIGKYNKYVFGWADWYCEYVDDETGNIDWAGKDSGEWNGNYSMTDSGDGDVHEPNSAMRDVYNGLRADAEDSFDIARLFLFGVAFNHVASSLEAVRVTKKYNSNYLSDNTKPSLEFHTVMKSTGLTPTLSLVKRF